MLETNESNASLKEGKNDVEVENMLSKITLMRSRDAEYVYSQALEMAKYAKNMGIYNEEVKHTEEAESARLCIPHFNIDSLLGWKVSLFCVLSFSLLTCLVAKATVYFISNAHKFTK